jgi:hypothetical protein
MDAFVIRRARQMMNEAGFIRFVGAVLIED